MRKVSLIILTVLLVTGAKSQSTWYQKEKKFHPFLAGAAAAGNIKMFSHPKTLVGSEIWSSIEAGMSNRNMSFGVAVTSYEYTRLKDTYLGLVGQGRAFYVGRLETWASVAYGIPLKGQLEAKFQGAVRERLQLSKNVAIEFSVQKTIKVFDNAALNKHLAGAFSVIINIHDNINSNGK